MPTLYTYVCHNPNCPFYLDRKEPFQWDAVPRDESGGQQGHMHCPFCQCGIDTHLEPVPKARVGYGQMTNQSRQPKIPERFRRQTTQILPLR